MRGLGRLHLAHGPVSTGERSNVGHDAPLGGAPAEPPTRRTTHRAPGVCRSCGDPSSFAAKCIPDETVISPFPDPDDRFGEEPPFSVDTRPTEPCLSPRPGRSNRQFGDGNMATLSPFGQDRFPVRHNGSGLTSCDPLYAARRLSSVSSLVEGDRLSRHGPSRAGDASPTPLFLAGSHAGCDRIGLLERSPAPVAGPLPATLSCRSPMLTCPRHHQGSHQRRVSRNAVSNRKNERWYRSASITACSIAAASDTRDGTRPSSASYRSRRAELMFSTLAVGPAPVPGFLFSRPAAPPPASAGAARRAQAIWWTTAPPARPEDRGRSATPRR